MNNEKNIFQQLANSFRRLLVLFKQPKRYFNELTPSMLDGGLVIFALFVFSLIQKLFWYEPGVARLSMGWAIEQALVNSLLVWSIFFTLYYLALTLLRMPVNIAWLVGQVGAAGLPVVLATLLSDLLWLAALLIPQLGAWSFWLPLHNILAWMGLLFSWPGWMGYLLMREGYKTKQLWAWLVPGAALILFALPSFWQLF